MPVAGSTGAPSPPARPGPSPGASPTRSTRSCAARASRCGEGCVGSPYPHSVGAALRPAPTFTRQPSVPWSGSRPFAIGTRHAHVRHPIEQSLRRRHRPRHHQQRRRLRRHRDEPEQPDAPVQVLAVPQLIGAGRGRGARQLLPSFLYLPAAGELPPESARACRGEPARARRRRVRPRARRRGAGARWSARPSRGCATPASTARARDPAVGQAPDDVREAVAAWRLGRAICAHMRDAWNAALAGGRRCASSAGGLLTVPASFDAAARELTVRAAQPRPGCRNVTPARGAAGRVLRLDRRARRRRGGSSVEVGDVVLVCDVGGGTTDFSLIAVREEDGELALERVAVGDHILLGGDNMDLALAYAVRERLADGGHRARRLAAARPGARAAARPRSACSPPTRRPSVPVADPRPRPQGRRRHAARRASTRDEVEQALVDGFFPRCDARRSPAERAAHRPAGDRPALRGRPGRHPPPGAVPRAPPPTARAAADRACSSTAA